VETQCGKNYREERESTIICEVQELQGFSVPGVALGFLDSGRSSRRRPSRWKRRAIYAPSVLHAWGG